MHSRRYNINTCVNLWMSLCLQVAEAALTDVRVEGSLLVHADCALGALEPVTALNPNPSAAPLPLLAPSGDLHVRHSDGRRAVLPARVGDGARTATKPWVPGAPVAADERLVFSDRRVPVHPCILVRFPDISHCQVPVWMPRGTAGAGQ